MKALEGVRILDMTTSSLDRRAPNCWLGLVLM